MNSKLPDAEVLISQLAKEMRPYISANTGLIGIHTGGVWVANRIHKILGVSLPLGEIDVSFYRDDYSKRGLNHTVRPSSIGFDVENKEIILIDDVLNSGRTARAAINEVFDHGRPNRVMLGILLDRGERQLPIRANFTAKSISVEKHKKISLEQKNDGLLTFSIRMENEKNESTAR